MNFSVQTILENENVKLIPLWENDFERLYETASDPKIWEQHPNKDRYQREVFKNFFQGALESKGAFLILDKSSNEIAGSTRFYDFNAQDNSIFIGYTFYGTKFWGSKINPQVKKLMLDYIFQFVDKVNFHVGAENIRSQKAMERLGAIKKGEIDVAYYGEGIRRNFWYVIDKPFR
ncbi:GNAT family N-acetyltransferase [Moheibacter sediminis]|uniref:Protein N-acetyltransferase, RimJ/RimL family n=1 Tax=Moheibacter sediminis TaxID=1434700 RepID=A0A1W2CGI5_9FLAO|nr:GNAT family N-acetyltransferase [Moheibacter sediminis]SMC83982.1 Protein N-acetyltransferase, RimJ/RimL family [Moheibacter sediminis]